jgi:hypothetical protein
MFIWQEIKHTKLHIAQDIWNNMKKKITFKNKREYDKWKKKQNDISNETKRSFEDDILKMVLKQGSECIFGTDVLYCNKKYDVVGKNWYINKYYKNAFNFCYDRNPDVDLNFLKAYEVPNIYMDEVDILKSCGGCYIPGLQIIIIKKGKTKENFKNKLDQELGKYRLDCEMEDVFAHEIFHAVSHCSGRHTRKYSNIEEEFVYKSTIEWFKSKGYKDEDIIDKYFLPFTLHDVIQNSKEKVLLELMGEKYEEKKAVEDFIKNNAKVLVNALIEKAKQIGRVMINPENAQSVIEADRFSSLDFG